MSVVIQRWRSKPTYLEEVRVTEENFREVASWIGAKSVSINYEGENITVQFREIPPRSDGQYQETNLWVTVGDPVYKADNGQVASLPLADLKKKYKKV